MKAQGLTRAARNAEMQTHCAQLNRVLDPEASFLLPLWEKVARRAG